MIKILTAARWAYSWFERKLTLKAKSSNDVFWSQATACAATSGWLLTQICASGSSNFFAGQNAQFNIRSAATENPPLVTETGRAADLEPTSRYFVASLSIQNIAHYRTARKHNKLHGFRKRQKSAKNPDLVREVFCVKTGKMS